MSKVSSPTIRFLGLELEAEGAVLRPRAETELLAEQAIVRLGDCADTPRVIDMCCGSGNLALAIAVNVPAARVWASDLTDGALAATRRNIARLDLAARVTARQGDLFAALSGEGLEGAADLIVANPPYISTQRLTEGDRAHLLEAEPREAFDGGPYGIALHQRLIAEAPGYLRIGGWLGLEFGLGQDRQIAALLKRSRAYGPPHWGHDAQGAARVVFVERIA